METPLTAGEFIKRFHLPQLVRISSSSGDDYLEDRNRSEHCTLSPSPEPGRKFVSSRAPSRPESSAPGWTFVRGSGGGTGCDSTSLANSLKGRDHGQAEAQFRSLVQLPPVQVPRSTLVAPHNRQQLVWRRPSERAPSCDRAQIKLAPLSKRPAQAKLQLDQPFLLYKAYRKLELCAFVLDLKNELNEKSGDPIYLPHNYPGWFSILSSDGHLQDTSSYLATMDQVCHSGGQVFLTRDELIGFQLPSRLSQLTKLNNNQLLAVPLAINLDSNSGTNGSAKVDSTGPSRTSKKPLASQQQQAKKRTGSISDLRQVTVGAGQVLRICGIYEDVLPLIEEGVSKAAPIGRRPKSLQFGPQMARPTGVPTAHGSPADPQRLYEQRHLAPPPSLYARPPGLEEARLSSFAQHNLVNQQFSARLGSPAKHKAQRYARCLILSEQSVDGLTGCLSRRQLMSEALKRRSGGECKENGAKKKPGKPDEQDDEEEIEVLVPLDECGRFYLCATSQTVADQLQQNCLGCAVGTNNVEAGALNGGHLLKVRDLMVFRLSQIAYLVNMNKKLNARQQHGAEQNHTHCTSATRRMMPAQSLAPANARWRSSTGLEMPLNVRLVVGPRPAHYSPSMFGAQTAGWGGLETSDGYFSSETNVGGHSLRCHFNRVHSGPADSSTVRLVGKLLDARAGSAPKSSRAGIFANNGQAPVCPCPRELTLAGGYKLFSAMLRLESLAKRDVLLACTIKQDPLEHLNVEGALPVSASNQPSKSATIFSHFATHRQKSGSNLARLLGGSSDGSLDERAEQAAGRLIGSRIEANKSLAKSSLSKLRACRSLISLNGRHRNKRRPNIPSSMLQDSDVSGSSFDTRPPDGASDAFSHRAPSEQLSSAWGVGGESELISGLMVRCNSGKCSGTSNCCRGYEQPTSSSSRLAERRAATKAKSVADGAPAELGELAPVVLLEFDCQDERLEFVRTFVEQSLPSASIPDLVLKRVQYCQRNSARWERQLKLSNSTLSRDFDSCQRQLRRQLSLVAGAGHQVASERVWPLRARDNGRPVKAPQVEQQQQQRAATGGPPKGQTEKRTNSMTTNSTASSSSRSSSGVSSAGERCASSAAAPPSKPDRAIGRHSSSSSSLEICPRRAQHEGACNSRLLRLVQRVLPAKTASSQPNPSAAPAGRGKSAARGEHGDETSVLARQAAPAPNDDAQQRRLMAELNGRLLQQQQQQQQQQACGGANEPPASIQSELSAFRAEEEKPSSEWSTLMNSQKVHRRLMQGASARHLPPCAREQQEWATRAGLNGASGASGADAEAQTGRALQSDAKHSSSSVGDDRSSADSSHLYESLERLNEALREQQGRAHEKRHAEGLAVGRSPRPTDGAGGQSSKRRVGNSAECANEQECGSTSAGGEPKERRSWRHKLMAGDRCNRFALLSRKQQQQVVAGTGACEFGADCGEQQLLDGGKVDTLEPVSIEACEQHHDGRLDDDRDRDSSSNYDSDSDSDSNSYSRSNRQTDRDGGSGPFSSGDFLAGQRPPLLQRRGRRSPVASGASSSSSSPSSSFSACETARPSGCGERAAPNIDGQDRQQIYVNLLSDRSEARAGQPAECGQQSERHLEECRADGQLESGPESRPSKNNRRTGRLVGRMERKLAKLRGRHKACELPRPASSLLLLSPPDPRQSDFSERDLRSLGWEPAHELCRAKLMQATSAGGAPARFSLARSLGSLNGPASFASLEAANCAEPSADQLSGLSSVSLGSSSFGSSTSSVSSTVVAPQTLTSARGSPAAATTTAECDGHD